MNIIGGGGLTGQSGGMFGMNQYGGYPTLQNTASAGGTNTPYGAGGFGSYGGTTGTAPQYPTGSATVGSPNWYGNPSPTAGGYGGYYPGSGAVTSAPGANPIGGGYQAGSTYDPALTSDVFGYLQSQVGQGVPMYPGQLTAPPNVNLTGLSNFLAGGQSNIPGMNQLAQIAQTGNPFNVSPEWQAMVAAQQQDIQQQAAQLKESMSAGGNLVGTPYGTTMQDFYSQTAAQQNALLAQLQQSAYNQAQQAQLGAQGQILGQVLPTSQQLQGVQQAGLSNAYQAWLQSQPQYNPLLGYQMAAATTFPSYMQEQKSNVAGTIGSVLGGIAGGFLNPIGGITSGLGGLGNLISGTPSVTTNYPSNVTGGIYQPPA